jgi:uracil-DNA glycosylase family 4
MWKMCWISVPSHRLIPVADALSSLIAEVRQCSFCENLPLGPRPIFQIGPKARILIVGQAPGRLTHAKGLPFDDVSGDRLRQWMGISRDSFYDDNLIACLPMGFCYPGKGKGGDLPPRPECAPRWRHSLMAHLPDVMLTLVIGQYALAFHFPDDKRTLTEQVRQWTGGNAMPLPHPSPRNGIWLKANPWFEAGVLPKLRERVHKVLHEP